MRRMPSVLHPVMPTKAIYLPLLPKMIFSLMEIFIIKLVTAPAMPFISKEDIKSTEHSLHTEQT